MPENYKNQNEERKMLGNTFLSTQNLMQALLEIKSLLAQYQRERRKVGDVENSGRGAKDMAVPKWVSCQRFTFFGVVSMPGKTKESKVVSFTMNDLL